MIDKLGEVIDVSLALSRTERRVAQQAGADQQEYPLGMLLDACRRYISRLGESAC